MIISICLDTCQAGCHSRGNLCCACASQILQVSTERVFRLRANFLFHWVFLFVQNTIFQEQIFVVKVIHVDENK